jgi:ABC-type multidrug transport system fused ATPase/permease subunit
MGASGAARLGLMAVDGRVDAVLERWRSMIPQNVEAQLTVSFRSIARFIAYVVISGVLLACPAVVLRLRSLPTESSGSMLPRWDSVFDAAVVLLFAFHLVWNALATTIQAEEVKDKIGGFVSSLRSAVDDRRKLLGAPPPNIQLQALVSPTSGLVVNDLWASHVAKRAWAVRGASFTCRNGEVIVVLGDDGAGKTRLLTVIAESIVSPPRRALSAQKVRGLVSVGGLEVSKWDNRQLKGRVGIALNDVRSMSDTAQILSGLSLEEILDPCTGIRNLDLSHSPGPNERAVMMLALKVTGLYTSLLQRLPSKLATIVTASEEDLLPSVVRPRYQILSPAEWSKLLLARVLAQAIYDNDNSSGSNDNLSNCLVGSVLLLDDHLMHLSEIDEARLLLDLRSSGAATVTTSNRWATGRFADRIVVMKDGAIVETGTHAELLNRGPQLSIYAAKWHAMTNS